MKHRTLTRITKRKLALSIWGTLFMTASICLGILFGFTLTSLTRVSIGGLKFSLTTLKSASGLLIGLSIFFLIMFIAIVVYLMVDKRKISFAISDNSIEVHSRKASYTVNLNNVDFIHLLRLPDAMEYGFRDVVALYEHKNFSWTVISPYLRDNEVKKMPIGLIQQDIIKHFHALKGGELREKLQVGHAIVFPYLAKHHVTSVDTSQQEDFDRELIIEESKGNLPVSQIMPTGAEIVWQGHQLTIDGIPVDMFDIADVQLHHFSKSASRKKDRLSWHYGQQVNLLDSDNTILAKIYLPSLLNGDIFLELLLEAMSLNEDDTGT